MGSSLRKSDVSHIISIEMSDTWFVKKEKPVYTQVWSQGFLYHVA